MTVNDGGEQVIINKRVLCVILTVQSDSAVCVGSVPVPLLFLAPINNRILQLFLNMRHGVMSLNLSQKCQMW